LCDGEERCAGADGGEISRRGVRQISAVPDRRSQVDPFLYFRDVLRRLPTHPQRLIAQLTPRGWADTFAKHLAA